MTKSRGQKAEDKKPRNSGCFDKKITYEKVRIFAKNAKKCKFAKRK